MRCSVFAVLSTWLGFIVMLWSMVICCFGEVFNEYLILCSMKKKTRTKSNYLYPMQDRTFLDALKSVLLPHGVPELLSHNPIDLHSLFLGVL